ncbi:MAG: hypothetical protein ACKOT0_00610 [bacterium]
MTTTRIVASLAAAGLALGAIATATAAPMPETSASASWVSGRILGEHAGMQVAVVGKDGMLTRGSLDADGKCTIEVARSDKPGRGLLLIQPDGSAYGPVILAHTQKKAYAQMTEQTSALGPIKLVKGSGNVKGYGEVQKKLDSSEYSTDNPIRIRNGRPAGLPLVFKAVFGKKGTVIDVCVDKPWPAPPGGDGEGYELIDQLYKQVWGNRTMSREEWDAITLPPTWMFWVKNAPREVASQSGEFMKSPECPEDGLWSYSEFFDHEFMNLTNFIEFNQPLNEEGTWTKSIMWKYHRLNYAKGSQVWYVQDPEGTRYLIVSRDPDRTTENPVLMPGWSLSKRYTLTEDFSYDLFGKDISNIRGDNGDSFQGCPTCALPDFDAMSS